MYDESGNYYEDSGSSAGGFFKGLLDSAAFAYKTVNDTQAARTAANTARDAAAAKAAPGSFNWKPIVLIGGALVALLVVFKLLK